MDPALASLLSPLGIALIGLAGVALGAWVNQRGARQTADRTLAGQRQMAMDDALRKWRAEAVHPLLQAVTQQVSLYQRLATQRLIATQPLPQDPDEIHRLIAQLAATPDWDVYTAPLRKVAPEELSQGLMQLRRAMDEAHAFLVRELEQRPFARVSDLPRLRAIGDRINEAEATIHDAAEVYVFRSMERTALPMSAPPRAWWRVWRR